MVSCLLYVHRHLLLLLRVRILTVQGFFVYTFIVWLATLRSTLIFSSLILTVWLTFLMLGCAYLDNVDAVPNAALVRAGGAFGIVASFLAWWAMLAGLLEPSNR